jgi:CRP-like cAMP-binding protein
MGQAGDAVGEFPLIDGGPRSGTATTSEACRLFIIERRAFLSLLGRTPDLLANLVVVLKTKIRRETSRGLRRMASA